MQPQSRRENETATEKSAGGIFEFRARTTPETQSDPLTEKVIGALIEVHRELGPGLSEIMYEEAVCHEFDLRGILYARQVSLPVIYKGKAIGEGRLDLVVEGKVILELKACEVLTPVHRAQLITYLRVTGLKVGLLVNFNVSILKDGIKRVILTH
jgi:GxxExxY protein